MAVESADASPSIESRLFDAARAGDVPTLGALLDAHPDKLLVRDEPYAMTLLHAAAQHLPAVDLLLRRGIDPNVRDRGDNSYPMHWAAAAGKLDVVRRLADAGGDVVGQGDDHALEVIGWATCWYGCDDPAHRAVADFLVSRGARHHIYSAIALGLPDEVRRIVRDDPSALSRRMSRNEDNQLPLHFAARMNRPDMVALLIELGADPLGVDASGNSVAVYATRPDVDRAALARVLDIAHGELDSATRGSRSAHVTPIDLIAALALGAWPVAERMARENPSLVSGAGILHVMAKRGDRAAVEWLLSHGADPSARWSHWDAEVTPLHLAIMGDHEAIVRLLVDAGADPTIRDSKHDADALGWAEFFEREAIVRLLPPRAK
jgi:ankyrin repeat protein